jgi:hypothetical protein
MVDVMDVFDDHAQYGNPEAWTAVSRQVVRVRAPQLAGRFWTEAGPAAWVAYGRDRSALIELGRHLRTAYHDRDVLSGLIAGADAAWFE